MSQQPTIMGPKKYKVPLGKGGLISDWIIIIAICTKNLGNIVHQSSLTHNISEVFWTSGVHNDYVRDHPFKTSANFHDF